MLAGREAGSGKGCPAPRGGDAEEKLNQEGLGITILWRKQGGGHPHCGVAGQENLPATAISATKKEKKNYTVVTGVGL
ncbi:hypothetical protein CYMTET_26087 [Cymbomonas tetramitiformis]|uniref:Uncharacterized protein n=1 Tax=Cymbomonas tetramitiformis TaxID=36881 RepID=A0AAE0EWN1_9CHLO|nr:hypothetical protein CYMTET_48566 [Cymbomonas tetramitiformis]KAK3265213.1 hypothetical protein CYMTET_26087 [Cymbomonas tetramitiformis]